GGILVLHAWWGLNDFVKNLCNRLATEGYLVLAPDLYNGAIAKTILEAEKLRGKLKRGPTSKQILEALKQLRNETGQPVGLIGFSLGAYWGLWLVEEKPKDIAATVLFYGTRGGDYAKTKSAFLGHFAETDEFVAESGRKKMEKSLDAAGKLVAFHVYPKTRHWFFEDDRPEYNPDAADLAWQRSIEFLHSHLG
ncbi:MAG: dienelactone hydrolase family protein, partial [Chloroflexi bacterium]|nr:dienelactone hydrolase family protein [Chloroflexota bacterium]